MSNNNNTSTSGGIGLTGLLGIVFIVLKLCKIIEWSWLWVLAPFWIPLGMWFIYVLVVLIIAYFIQ